MSEELCAIVEQLVDSIVGLVLCAVTLDMEQVKIYCESIAENTNLVVGKAQQIALDSNESDFQVEITNCINNIAETIENLVNGFLELVTDAKNPAKQRQFAEAAKNVGDSINRLVVSTDTTSNAKLVAAIQDAKESHDWVVGSVSAGKDELLRTAKLSSDRSIHLVKLALKAAADTADGSKARKLNTGADQVKRLTPELLLAAKTCLERRDNASQAALTDKKMEFERAMDDLWQAAKIVPDFGNRLTDALNHVRRLIELAAEMEQAGLQLLNAIGKDKDTFLAAARNAVNAAKAFLQQAQVALDKEKDPGRRLMIQQLLDDIRAASQALMLAAKEAQADPNNPDKRAAVDAANKRLNDLIKMLTAITDPNEAEQRLKYTTDYLDSKAKEIATSAPTRSADQLRADSRNLSDLANTLATDTSVLASQTIDPAKAKRIVDTGLDAQAAGLAMARAANSLADKPGDAARVADVRDRQGELAGKLDGVRIAAGFIDDPQVALARLAEQLEQLANRLARDAPNLTREQIQDYINRIREARQQVAEQARRVAESERDANKKKRILDAVKAMEDASDKALDVAEKLKQKPGDKQLAAELDKANRVFLERLNQVKAWCGLGGTVTVDSELVVAARQQANAALQLADEVEKLAAKMTDAARKKKILDASDAVRRYAASVIDAAEDLSHDPDNVSLQRRLDQAQSDLARAIENVVNLTSLEQAELARALRDMNSSGVGANTEAEVLRMCQECIQDIETFLSKTGLPPKEYVDMARALSDKAKWLAAQLRELAKTVVDPVLKEQLLSLARVLTDKGIQIKILAAVQVAGGDNKANQVGSCAQGLKSTLKEATKVLGVCALKRRVKALSDRALAIQRVVDIWQKFKQ